MAEVLLAVLLAVLGLGKRKGGDDVTDDKNDDDDATGLTPKQVLWRKLESLPWLDVTQRYFLMLVAYGESAGTWRPTAHNDSPSEVAASSDAWDNNPELAAKLTACGGTRSQWADGSFGLFQRLGPYFGDDLLDIFGSCAHVHVANVWDPDYQIVSAIKNARRLQSYDAWKNHPTVGTLRLGWYGPGAMKPPQDAERLNKYRKHARAVRLPEGIVDARIAVFPKNYVEIFQRLKAGYA